MRFTLIALFIIGIIFFSFLIFTGSKEIEIQDNLSSKIEKVQKEIPEDEFIDNGKLGDDYTYPDPKLTQGKAATTSTKEICGKVNGKTYSERNRKVTEATKREIYEAYGIAYPQPKGEIEVDHFINLAIGGSNATSNLWAQSNVYPGFREKDKLEAFLAREVCQNKTMTPEEAQRIIFDDWVLGYITYVSQDDNLGSSEDDFCEEGCP